MIHYDYIYIIPIFTRYKNIQYHYAFLSQYPRLKNKSILYIIRQCGDSTADEIQQAIENIPPAPADRTIDVQLIKNINWGMLVGSLWDGWQYVKQEGITADYVLAMEDDYVYNHWDRHEDALDQGFIYSGMFSCIGLTAPTEDQREMYLRFFKQGYKDVKGDPEDEGAFRLVKELGADKRRWTDGGLYFLKYSSLQEIEDKLGIFTKAPYQEIKDKEDYAVHGIRYGEIGFPTSLYGRGYKFTAMLDFIGMYQAEPHRVFNFAHFNPADKYPDWFLNDSIPDEVIIYQRPK